MAGLTRFCGFTFAVPRLRLAAGAGREAGDRLIGSADLDGVHGNQYLPCFRAKG